MKIGIITFHFACNYGAVLQCYALQTYLEKLGNEVEVINYRPSYHTVRYEPWKNPFVVANSNLKRNKNKNIGKKICLYCRGLARAICESVKQTDKGRFVLFNNFTEKYLNQTRKYTSIQQLRKNPPEDDLYISGSDQLWNPMLLDFSFDEAYFLKFGDQKVKRVTYAVSLKEKYTEEEKANLVSLSQELNQICIREHNLEYEKLVNKPVDVCVDPTLLLDSSAYREVEAGRLVQEPYVFVYGFESSEELDKAVKETSEKLGLKVINGSPNRIRLSGGCDTVFNYGPSEFLSYIKYADFVVTNSFHGTAFSIIYHKQFEVVPHSTRGRRMTELLQKLDLSNRIWSETRCNCEDIIDYTFVEEKRENLMNCAYEYFQRSFM